jgi:hypothetical protein
MPRINYIEIFKRAWQITWRNRYLWWFGLFLSLGSGGMGWNFNLPWYEKKEGGKLHFREEDFFNFLSTHAFWIVLVIIIFLTLVIILAVLRIISQAGIIKSFSHIDKNEAASFGAGFREGKKYFWKMLSLGLILGMAMLSIIVVLAVPTIFLFVLNQGFLAIFTIIMAFFILIPLMIIFAFVSKFSFYYLILSNLSIFSSIERGYQLFKKNILPSVIMGLLFIPLGIALGIGIFAVIFAIAVPFTIIGLLAYLLLSKIGAILVVVAGGTVVIAAAVFIQSVYQTFSQTSWYLFFKEISSVKIKEEEKQESVVLEKYPSAEQA